MTRGICIRRRARWITKSVMGALALANASNVFGQTTASWLLPINGTWTDATKWSTDPFYPNNDAPPGSTYLAQINASGSPYTVSIKQTASLSGLELASPDATVQFTAGSLVLSNALSVQSGAFFLGGGTVSGGSMTVGSSGVLSTTGRTRLQGTGLSGTLDAASGTLSIGGGFAFDDGTIRRGGTSPIVFTTGAISGNGTFLLDWSIPQHVITATSGTLTFGPNVRLFTAGAGATFTIQNLQNQGFISARTPDRAIHLEAIGTSARLANEGTLEATNGGYLRIAAQFSNTGTIVVNNGHLEIDGTRTFPNSMNSSDFGTVIRNGGTVTFSNITANNGGATLSLDTGLGPNNLISAGINGGTIVSSLGGRMALQGTSTLSAVNAGVGISVQSGSSVISGGLHFLPGGSLSFEGAVNATVTLKDTQNIDGIGEIVFNGSASDSQTLRSDPGTATFGSGITFRTGTSGGTIQLSSALVNQGTISAQTPGKTLTIFAAALTNSGTIEAINGGRLEFQGASLPTNLGVIRATGGGVIDFGAASGGTSAFVGTWYVGPNSTIMGFQPFFTESHADITLDGPGSSFSFLGFTQNFGHLTITNGRNYSMSQSAFITNSGSITIGPQSTMKFGSSLSSLTNTGTIDLNSAMIVDYDRAVPSPFDMLVSQVQSGYNGGLWNGIGINSSAAASDPSLMIGLAENSMLGISTFGGFSVDASSVLLLLTHAGDSDLDGTVDLTDFDHFLTGYSPIEATAQWMTGDFNYSGTVDLTDFELYLNGYYALGGSMQAISDAVKSSGLPESDQSAMLVLVATVPEPLGVLSLSILIPWFLTPPRRRGGIL